MKTFIRKLIIPDSMTTDKEYELKKLNDLLSASFLNIKYDIRELNCRMDAIRSNVDSMNTESVHRAIAAAQQQFLEQQKTINALSTKLSKLESGQLTQTTAKTAQKEKSTDIIAELRKKTTKKDTDEESVYEIPPGQVRITDVNFQSKGGRKNLNGEWVEICGYGGISLTGYTLHDKGRKHVFRFPEGFKIYGPTKIFTGKGKNRSTKLYWKQPRPVWNDNHDIATLRNNKGKTISQVSSEKVHDFKVLK
jgi:hypothetical protein